MTETGTRLLFLVLQRIHPSLKVHDVRGTLTGKLRLEGVRYITEDFHFESKILALVWHPRALIQGRLHIVTVAMNRVTLTLPPNRRSNPPSAVEELPQVSLPLRATLEHFTISDLRIRQGNDKPLTIKRFTLSASFDGPHLTLARSNLDLRDFHLAAHGKITLEAHYPLLVQFKWRHCLDTCDWQGEGHLDGDLTRLVLRHQLTTPFRVDTRGILTHLLTPAPGFDIATRWQAFSWPLDKKIWHTHDGQIHLVGTHAAYQLRLTTRLEGPSLPPATVILNGNGSTQSLQITRLNIRGDIGDLSLQGKISWQPLLAWHLTIQGQHINPATWQPEWPGELTTAIETSGQAPLPLAWQRLEATIDVNQLKGRLRGQSLEATGRLQIRGHIIRTDDFQFGWGQNRIEVYGSSTAKQLNLSFRLHLHQPQLFTSGLQGHLDGIGRITGISDNPEIALHLRSRGLAWQQENMHLSIHSLKLHAKLRPDDPDSYFQLTLDRVRMDRLELHRLIVTGQGSLTQHHASLQAIDDQARKALVTVHGGYRDGVAQWEGKIQKLPLAMGQPFLPSTFKLGGSFEAEFFYQQRGEQRSAWLQWHIPRATLTPQAESHTPLRLYLHDGHGHIQVDQTILQADLLLPFPQRGQIQAKLRTDLDNRILAGTTEFHITDLKEIQIFIPQLETVQGRVEGHLQVAGNYDHPQIKIDLHLTDGSAKVPAAGLALDQIELHLNSDSDKSLIINGLAHSDPGILRINGHLTLEDVPLLTLVLTGKRFTISNLPEAQIQISPSLEIKARERHINVQGKVELPYARLEIKKALLPEQNPDLVTVSEDEIIIGQEPRKKSLPFFLDAKIQVRLGDVVFKGYGVKTKLAGEFRLRQHNLVTHAEGEIQMVKGKFEAYGQKLQISRGRLIFNGPVQNPMIDLHIVRQIKNKDITVAMEISGFADDPKLMLHSTPPLPDQEILSYLLTGRSTWGEGQEPNTEAALTKAVASLGISYLNRLGLVKIARITMEENSLILGKYLVPDLYVGYAVDIFTGLGEAIIRYRLYRNLELEARSGRGQESLSIDYSLETD
ncbi:translocation and assembly module TamB [Methylomarinovum tepidoasis]|uniref:Translocation and assembly module TamB n=2 Tax=Methylomarinovum tepidoasis TaxID=2840183 RepID=A0AAU9C4U0_9GAMM|nr:translocation and assembly module TamB [Methylomarinovum sp. IN45]